MPTVLGRGRTKTATDWLLSQVTVADEQLCVSRISDLWTCKYSPQSESELAVHGDKLKELTNVVQCCLTTKRVNHRGGPVLLLCGPPGSGKISSLRIALQTIFPHGNIQWMEWLDESLGSDEITQLEEFVRQSCRYQIVTEKLTDMNCVNEPSFVIIVLKNLPVSLADCASRFHSLLRFHATNASPSSLLVVSCTSSSSSRESLLSERILCPISLRSELNISRVEFNPVAPTLLLKALNRIVKQEHPKSKMPSRAVLQQIAGCCAGDLRTAVNQLQFFCQSDAQPDTGRDPGLSLFHALGKLLYGKRHKPESLSASDVKIVKSELSAHLANWKRPELTFDLDDVLEQCQMSGDQAISWLHENYIDFMPHMTAINWVCQHVSWADSQLSGGMNWRLGLTPAADWNANEKVSGAARQPSSLATRHYGALVVIRALLLSHNMTEESIASDPSDSRTRPRQGFRPLRAPSVQDSWKVAGQRRDAWCDLGAQCAETFGQLYGFGNFFIANRCRWLYDYLPLAGKLSSIRAYLDKNPSVSELVDTISTFSRSSRPGERRLHSGYNKKPVNISISDGICPPDAILEGDALLIEEDISDSEHQ